jgi:hypothetical protein
MRDMGGIIVGDFAKAFFTGEDPPVILELLFRPERSSQIKYCQQLWHSFFGKTVETELPSRIIDGVGINHWTWEVSRSAFPKDVNDIIIFTL